jgi:hypothetical protein
MLFEKPADILSLDGSILGVFPNRELFGSTKVSKAARYI